MAVQRLDVPLPHGALVVMGAAMQKEFHHEVPAVTGQKGRSMGRRINITIRAFKTSGAAGAPAAAAGSGHGTQDSQQSGSSSSGSDGGGDDGDGGDGSGGSSPGGASPTAKRQRMQAAALD